jgi:thiamine pyrophosphate-dependent acetolactate synthase large subunit-like protein
MPARTVADDVGAALAAAGVTTAFGVLGSGNLVVTNALRAAGAAFHAARHEGGAIAMADGWARVTGAVGVCTVHQGPGLTNAMTGLAEAVKARTPLLVLAADTPAAAVGSNFRIDQHALVEAVGARSALIYSPATAAADALRALRRAALERRPVVLMLPIDLQAAPSAGAADALVPTPPPAPPVPAPEAIEAAADLLAGAECPLLIGGRGAVLAGAAGAIAALGDRTGALLATSAMAHGLFAGRPYVLGISGGFAPPVAAELMPAADVVVSFGATLNHWTTRHGALLDPHARLVAVDADPAAIGGHRRADLAVVGDARAAALALDAALTRRGVAGRTGFRTPGRRGELAERRWRAEPFEDGGTAEWIDPRAFSIALADLLPADVGIAVDSGHFMGWPSMYLDPPDARSWVFPNGFQAVGLGLGCAIGAAVARPGRITVAALGDGGLYMALEELETAARLGLRLLVVVYDDAAYGAEVHHFGPLGHDVSGTRFASPADLAALGRAAGCGGVVVRSVADLAPVAAWVRDGSGPLVVDAKVSPEVRAEWLEEAFRAG